ncbi:MAG: PLP-dependent aminotransferase family protein [Cytophagales bacterium]|nr:PLP-dependent aminotransferase family protein [Cytophagales bacterium]
MNWTLASRAARMNPSFIREILKVTERPGIISFAGGLPSPKTFPITEVNAAVTKVLTEDGEAALQYATSEGYSPLREAVAKMLPWHVSPDQVLITTGSQQGLDLIAKILIDKDSIIWVESPTYLGAVQAFTPMEPRVVSVACDDDGLDVDALEVQLNHTPADQKPRFIYLLPNFQNPTGRTMPESRRAKLAVLAQAHGLCIIEDNPYGDLWFDEEPPATLTSRNPDGTIYLGSFSKILAPGLRLGFMVLPPVLYPKMLQAKQAADLHTPSLNQRVLYELLHSDFIPQHKPSIRALYKSQLEAMLAALDREFGRETPRTVTWNKPIGGMFLWLTLPKHMNSQALLHKAVAQGIAFVPGAAFYANEGEMEHNKLRLSFVTASVEQINQGIAILAKCIADEK